MMLLLVIAILLSGPARAETREKSDGMSTRETDGMVYGIVAGMCIGAIGGGLLAVSIGGETTTTETTGDPAVEEAENKAAILLPIGVVVGAVVPGYFPFAKLGKRIGKTMTKEDWKLITPQVKASMSHDRALIVRRLHPLLTKGTAPCLC